MGWEDAVKKEELLLETVAVLLLDQSRMLSPLNQPCQVYGDPPSPAITSAWDTPMKVPNRIIHASFHVSAYEDA